MILTVIGLLIITATLACVLNRLEYRVDDLEKQIKELKGADK